MRGLLSHSSQMSAPSGTGGWISRTCGSGATASGELTLCVERSVLSTCDLSQVRLERLQSSSITDSKLFGTDLALACSRIRRA